MLRATAFSVAAILLATAVAPDFASGLPVPSIEQIDVREGDPVHLECPRHSNSSGNSHMFWILKMFNDDVVATMDTSFVKGYTVAVRGNAYLLDIDSVRYERDNGVFRCELKQEMSGKQILKEFRVTILMHPGEPKISPDKPFAEEGKPFNLTCSSVGGSPDPDISWMRSGQEVPSILIPGGHRKNQTRAVLTIVPTRGDDRTQYACMVRSRALPIGTHLDTKVTLRVSYAPRVTVLEGDDVVHAVEGEDAVLSCEAEANPEVRSRKWYRSGQLVSHNPVHFLKSVTRDDSNEYTCTAHNGIQPDGQVTVKLDVQYGPHVRVLTPEREAKQGDKVTVTCQVESNPEPSTIYWIRDSDDFRQDGPVLNIEPVSARDNGLYHCVAEVTMVRTTKNRSHQERQQKVIGNATLQLNVKHKPGVSRILPLNPIAVVKKPFSMECTSDPKGYPDPDYRWWKKGNEHTSLSSRANYTILSVTPEHEGIYFCQPMNKEGQGTMAQVYLQVNEAPRIVNPLQPQIRRKTGDQPDPIMCRASGKPKPFVWWTHNGQNISTIDQRYSVSTNENADQSQKTVSVVSTLSFVKTLTANERGKYACHYSNGFGDPAMSEMTLRVEHSPEVRHTYNRVAFDVGDNAYLECRMQAYPEPMFEWMFQSRTVGTYGPYSTNRTDNGDDVYTGLLRINNIKEDDYGDYTCLANNKVGQDQRTIIKLVKRSQPDRPMHVVAVDAQSDRVTLAWKPGFNGGYADTKYIVSVVDEEGRERNESCHQAIQCTITGLESLSRYVVKAMASNRRGHSAFSEPTEVMTKLAVQEMPVPVAQYDFTNGMVHVSLKHLPAKASLEHFVLHVEGRHRGEEAFRVLHEAYPVDGSHSQVEVYTAHDQVAEKQLSDVRVMVCLQSNLTWCGDARVAEPFDHENWISSTAASSSLSTISLIVTICVGLGLFCLVLVLLCCCWKRHSSNQQTEKKDYNAQLNSAVTNSQPPCYFDSMTKSGIVETAMDEPIKSNGAVPGAEQPVNGGYVHAQPQYLDHDAMYGTMMNTNDYYIGKQDHYSPYDPTPGYFGYPDDHGMGNEMHYDVSGLPNPYGTSEDLLHAQYLGHTPQHMGDVNCNESVDSVQTNGQRRVVREIIV